MSLVTFITLPSETCSVHWQQIPAVQTAADAAEQILDQRTIPFLVVNSCSMSPVPGYPHLPCKPGAQGNTPRAQHRHKGLVWSETGIIQLSPPGLNLKNSLFCFLQAQRTVKREPSVLTLGRAQTINSSPRALHWGRAICRAGAWAPTNSLQKTLLLSIPFSFPSGLGQPNFNCSITSQCQDF